MPAPRTYTRQDVAEIHCHSGPAILNAILDLCIAQGARLAEPGEFTLRAFLNGRIDLAQAEAVADLTRASSTAQGKLGISQLKGRLSARIDSVMHALTDILAALEVAIDYPDEDEEIIQEQDLLKTLASDVLRPLEALSSDFTRARIFRTGAKVLIAGKPNVGKSSLLNALACEERAIVTKYPGTTRDTIEVQLEIGGIAVTVTDTAGIRLDPDPVEAVGIERVKGLVSRADLVLWLLDLDSGISAEDIETWRFIESAGILLVFNKADLTDEPDQRALRMLKELEQRTGHPLAESFRHVLISAKEHHGLKRLEAEIAGALTAGNEEPPEAAPNARHKALIDRAIKGAKAAREGLERNESPEIVAIDVRSAMEALGEITGQITTEDLLHNIFSRFCLGK